MASFLEGVESVLVSAMSVKTDRGHVLGQCMSAELKLKVLQERMAGRKDTGSDLKRREGEYLSLVHIGVSIFDIICEVCTVERHVLSCLSEEDLPEDWLKFIKKCSF